jgi:hypothetical protein
MALSTAVKYFDSAMQGAPGIVNAAGGLLSILRACLVNGFNQVTLNSLTVSNGIATASRALGMAYRTLQVIEISGATPSELNGQKRILSVGVGFVTFDASGVSDGAATGTITCKVAPAGWSEPFTSGNIAVFRGASGERNYFRVDDTPGSEYVVVKGYTGMSDANTGDGLYQPESGNYYWIRPYLTGATWAIVADDRTMYMLSYAASYSQWYQGLQAMGELYSFVPNDTGKGFIAAAKGSQNGSNSGAHQRTTLFCTAAYNSTIKRLGASLVSGSYIRAMRQVQDQSGGGGPTFPSAADQGMMLSDNLIVDYTVSGAPIIARTPGAFWVLADAPFQSVWTPCPTFEGVGGLAGRQMAMLSFLAPNSNTAQRVAVDITGPWEYNS